MKRYLYYDQACTIAFLPKLASTKQFLLKQEFRYRIPSRYDDKMSQTGYMELNLARAMGCKYLLIKSSKQE
jgi:hypothetical protein